MAIFFFILVNTWTAVCLSPKGQVCEEGDSQEDGRDSTTDVCDVCEDGGLETAGYGLSGEVLFNSQRAD